MILWKKKPSMKGGCEPQAHPVNLGMTHDGDFVFTEPTSKLIEVKNQLTRVFAIKSKITSYGSIEGIEALHRKVR